MFTNNKLTVNYANRSATFTIIDEEFFGNNRLGRINRLIVVVSMFDATGKKTFETMGTTVIGLGDGIVGIRSDVPELRGKLLTHENMHLCVVELYEDE
jgi:hypothetical protein